MAIIMGKGCLEAIYGLMGWNPFPHFFFWNIDISPDIEVTELKFVTIVKNIPMEGPVSYFFHLGLSFYFMSKNR